MKQWVTSKEALGLASSTKRPTSCVMIAKIGMKKKLKEGETEKEGLAELEAEFTGLYAEMVKEVDELVRPFFSSSLLAFETNLVHSRLVG
jgi:H/ACA ribonucleoprotein complex subunit 2